MKVELTKEELNILTNLAYNRMREIYNKTVTTYDEDDEYQTLIDLTRKLEESK